MSVFPFRYKLSALAVACAFAPVAVAQTAQPSGDNVLPEVVVTSAPADGVARNASVGGFSETPLLETPASVSVITREQMQERAIRTVTEAVKYDASVNDSYNAVGFNEQFTIRGYILENATSYRKDGMPFSAESMVPLENKERVEILKGVSGLQAGTSTPGGIINFVTKRPTDTPLRTVTTEIRERGTVYGAVDLGGRSDDKRFGYRINAAAEEVKSYIRGSDGNRQFVSGSFDWKLSDRAVLQLDMDYQHKSQLTVPGFQLFGSDLPTGVSAKTMLNNQPWSKPTVDDANNIGLRFDYKLNDNWHATLAASRYELRRDDRVAMPYGCGGLTSFCADGTYNVYEYKSENEKRTLLGTKALLQGQFDTGLVRHDLTLGLTETRRRESAGDCVFGTTDCAGSTPNGKSNDPIINPSPIDSTAVVLRRKDDERSFFTQDVMTLSKQFKLHAGFRYVELDRQQFDATGVEFENYKKDYLLPNVALVYMPKENVSVYGSYSQGLEHGGVAASYLTNGNTMLKPRKSKQVEVGVKADVNTQLSMTAALFRINKPLEYVDSAFNLVSNGDDVHQGVELGLQGRATRNLSTGISMTAIDAKQKNTGEADLDGKRTVNVPKFRSVAYLDYTLPQMPAMKLNTTWVYSSSKAFDAANKTIVDGYHVFNAGARYQTRMGNVPTTLSFNIYNVFNKFYWRDTTQVLGGYLFPGAPRTFRLTAQFDF